MSLLDKGIDVLLDDRDMRAGFKFKDADLFGTPIRINIGTRSLEKDQVEMKLRSEENSSLISIHDTPSFVIQKVKELYDSTK